MLFPTFRCYPVDKLISIIYKLYNEISLLHPSILKEHVSSSYIEKLYEWKIARMSK